MFSNIYRTSFLVSKNFCLNDKFLKLISGLLVNTFYLYALYVDGFTKETWVQLVFCLVIITNVMSRLLQVLISNKGQEFVISSSYI